MRNINDFLNRHLLNHPHRLWRVTLFGCVCIWAALLFVCMKYGGLI